MQLRKVLHVLPALVLALAAAIAACSQPRTALERVLDRGELLVLMRNSATTYYEGPLGPTGLEYDLARRFAEQLGVELKIRLPGSLKAILHEIAQGKADLAAAGLTVTDQRRELVRFGPTYQEVTEQVIYRYGTPPPRSPADLANGHLEVVAGSSHAERLRQLKERHPELDWYENPDVESDELLNLLWEQVIDYTVVDSNEAAVNRRYMPELRVAFDLSEAQQLAWAFPKGTDDTLYQAAVEFFEGLRASGELARLVERHYGHIDTYDYAGTSIYMRHVQRRLPKYRPLFEQAAKEHGLDWRLLAAMAYQESHWDPKAVSPTGVRGLMMLTRATAQYIGIEKRTDPLQSVQGGAQYLRGLLERLPPEVAEPDRSWLALAAYNVGLGHVEDARWLAEQAGDDPNKWADVKRHLPLLRLKKWYRKTRHGYARGNEPVRYVENIRSYYDILTWMTEREQPPPVPPLKALAVDSPVL